MSRYADQTDLDEDSVVAAAELGGRTGATSFEIGFVNDDPPHEWYVKCQYLGDRIIVEGFDRPDDACEAFAARILNGGICTHCEERTVTRASAEARDPIVISSTMANARMDRATRRRLERAAQRAPDKLCVWERQGRTWKRGCEEAQL